MNKYINALGLSAGLLLTPYLIYKTSNIETEIKRVKVESIISEGKAIYMPGSVCILKATSDITGNKIREFAAACIRSHERWLLINDKKTNYSDEADSLPPPPLD